MWLLHLLCFGLVYPTTVQNTSTSATATATTNTTTDSNATTVDPNGVTTITNDSRDNTILFDQLYSDYLICANHRNRDGSFTYEKCPRYASTGFFPFCVYLASPSTTTKKGSLKYGCVYGHKLPHQCIENGSYFWEHITLPMHGKNYSGAAVCCSDNFCNEVEDPLFAFVRLQVNIDEKTSQFGEYGLPVFIAFFIIVAGFIPLCSGKLIERHQHGVLRAESPGFLEDNIGGTEANKRRMKEVREMVSQSMQFPSLKKMQQTVKNMLSPNKYGFHTNSSTHLMMVARLSGSAPLPGATDEEATQGEEERPYKELIFNDNCRVFQRCQLEPCKVKREIPSKLENLAQRLVEHGPYHYSFDPVELGDLFDAAANTFSMEPTLLDLHSDISIYGNLEGSYGDLFRWMHKNGWPPKRKVLFLGGIFNEGNPYSLETIALIFALKVMMPEQVFVLRGAAESKPMRLEQGRLAIRIIDSLQEVLFRACAFMPLAATIGPVFCSHGGFPLTLKELKKVARIKRPLYSIQEGSIAAQLIFSQASPQEGPIPGCRGRGFSKDTRPDLPCKKTDQTISLFVRARNVCTSGYLFIGESILTLWSVPGVPVGNKGGASLYIDREMNATLNRMGPFGLYTTEELKSYQEQQKKREEQKKKVGFKKSNRQIVQKTPNRSKFKSSDDPTKPLD